MAFFPCTRFEAKIPLMMRGDAYQQKKWTDLQKLEANMHLCEEQHLFFNRICQLVAVALRKGLKLIIENPYTQPHYLTTYWCIKPALIDKDRTDNGDYFKKPTQYFFINCEPKRNLVFEPLEYVDTRRHDRCKGTATTTRQTERSMMHPQYARRFIKQYIL